VGLRKYDNAGKLCNGKIKGEINVTKNTYANAYVQCTRVKNVGTKSMGNNVLRREKTQHAQYVSVLCNGEDVKGNREKRKKIKSVKVKTEKERREKCIYAPVGKMYRKIYVKICEVHESKKLEQKNPGGNKKIRNKDGKVPPFGNAKNTRYGSTGPRDKQDALCPSGHTGVHTVHSVQKLPVRSRSYREDWLPERSPCIICIGQQRKRKTSVKSLVTKEQWLFSELDFLTINSDKLMKVDPDQFPDLAVGGRRGEFTPVSYSSIYVVYRDIICYRPYGE
jgi:hypothetical protein